jgi:hypothetical protein
MFNVLAFLMQTDTSGAGNAAAAGLGIGFTIVYLVILVLMIAGMWKVFEKAGEPGWAAIVPIYNVVVLLKICGRPLWWIILFFVPFVSFIMWFVICFDVAKRFGKGAGFAIGLAILSFIFFPMLAWGDAKYQPAPAMA